MAKPKILQQLNAEASSQILLKEDPDIAMEAATKQYVDNNGGIFWAEFNVTTLEELQTAYSQGKSINVLYSNCIYTLDHIANVSNGIPSRFYFSNSWANNGHGGYIQSISYGGSSWNAWSKQYLPSASYTSANSNDNYFTNSNFMNGASDITLGQARNIYCSTSEPTSSDGNVGDIWLVYEA